METSDLVSKVYRDAVMYCLHVFEWYWRLKSGWKLLDMTSEKGEWQTAELMKTLNVCVLLWR